MNPEHQLLTKAQTTKYRGLKQAKNRNQTGLFMLEGVRLCEEAFNSSLVLEGCIIRKNNNKLAVPAHVSVFEATQTQLEQISDSKTPQGIICIAHIPKAHPLPTPTSAKILLVMDRLADPGNMGTIFRTALWFGINDILIGPNCVDPYSPKVVRSSMGAIASLRIHVSTDLRVDAGHWQQNNGTLAALHLQGTPLSQFQPEGGLFLVVGSEAHGVAADLLQLATPISIERRGVGESLNAAMAVGIALYALTTN